MVKPRTSDPSIDGLDKDFVLVQGLSDITVDTTTYTVMATKF